MGGWNALGNPTAIPTPRRISPEAAAALSSTVARYFVARTDGSGHGLTSGCGISSPARRSMRGGGRSRYDDTGSLIENASNRYSFNNEEALAIPMAFRIRVARRATELASERRRHRPQSDVDAAHLCAARHRLARRRPHPRRPAKIERVVCGKDPRTLYRARIVLAGLSISLPCSCCRCSRRERAGEARQLGPVNTMIELPAYAGKQAMPMMAPDVRYAFCRFDLSNGPVRLSATIADDLWLIGFTHDGGDEFLCGGRRRFGRPTSSSSSPQPIRRSKKRASIRPESTDLKSWS
jgi:hypothetical protein